MLGKVGFQIKLYVENIIGNTGYLKKIVFIYALCNSIFVLFGEQLDIYKVIAEKAFKFMIYASDIPVGYIVMTIHGNVLQFDKADVYTLNGNSNITSVFIDSLYNVCSKNDLTVASQVYGEKSVLNHIRDLLLQSKFNYDSQTVNYVKSNNNEKSQFRDEYTLEPYTDRGEEYFIEILKQCCIDDPYHTPETIVEAYQTWKNNKFNDSHWKLVSNNGELIGIILPMENNTFKKNGNITYIGVLPDKRKAEHGKKLHNIALDILFNDIKVDTYLGMTHKDNKGMRTIFEKNACIFNDTIVFNAKQAN